VILVEKDEAVVGIWRELQMMTPERMAEHAASILSGRTTSSLVGAIAGGFQLNKTLAGDEVKVTPRMMSDWAAVRRRILANLDKVKSWEVIHGDYHDAPDIAATWFVDPPYQPNGTMAGSHYRCSSADIDYEELADWCRRRRGQVIVCEQHPAAWLPFKPLAYQRNGASQRRALDNRLEVMWHRAPANLVNRRR
jgi:hypothetical protein